jgi:hypothetical protein
VFDAVSHQLDHFASSGELADRLRRPSLVKVIRSHGEGIHAKLPVVSKCTDVNLFATKDTVSVSKTYLINN